MTEALKKAAEERMLLNQQKASQVGRGSSIKSSSRQRSYEAIDTTENLTASKAAALATIDFRFVIRIKFMFSFLLVSPLRFYQFTITSNIHHQS